MKKTIFLALAIIALLSSCEEKLPLYSDSQAYLNFDTHKEDTIRNYSFALSGGKQKDTVWVRLNTMGFVSDKPRAFKLKQVPFGKLNAEAGKHYVGFDTKEMMPYFIVPANAVNVDVPIVVLCDPTLDNDIYNLRIQVEPNGIFMPGYQEQNFFQITITNKINKPALWIKKIAYYFGDWGPVKHRFMIDATGKAWDDNFIQSIWSDSSYTRYLQSKLKRALDKLNKERAEAGKSMLKEKDGTIVTIGR